MQSIPLPHGGTLEFILAVSGRRYSEFVELLQPLQQTLNQDCTDEALGEVPWQGLRLVVAHDAQAAADQSAARDKLIATLEQQAEQWTGKLDAQDAGQRARGRKLSDGGARARFYHAVCEAHLARIIRVDLKSEMFTYSVDERALAHARLMDGKLLLVTNARDLTPSDVVGRYKSLADIERGFRVLKSEIEIGPVYHRLPERIRAHATLCFMALILHRILRQRLRGADNRLSPERALSLLRRIQHHRLTLDGTQAVTGVSSMTAEQIQLFADLGIDKPTKVEQLTLL